MKILTATSVLLLAATSLSAQVIDQIINPDAVEKIERTLSADDMQGRQTFKPGIENAADYIEREFHTAGLQPLNGGSSYRQTFSMFRTKLTSASATLDGQPLAASSGIALVSNSAHVQVDNNSGYEKAYIKAGANIFVE